MFQFFHIDELGTTVDFFSIQLCNFLLRGKVSNMHVAHFEQLFQVCSQRCGRNLFDVCGVAFSHHDAIKFLGEVISTE